MKTVLIEKGIHNIYKAAKSENTLKPTTMP